MLTRAKLKSRNRVSEKIWHLVFELPFEQEIYPGQFFMIKIDEGFEFKHPFSVHRFSDGVVEFLIESRGYFSRSLSYLNVGGTAQLTGPLGNGFKAKEGSSVLAVGGGIGCAPLAMFECLHYKARYLVGSKDEKSFPGFDLPPEKTLVVTENGKYGKKGLVTDYFIEFIEEGEKVFACGPDQMIIKLAQQCRSRGTDAYFCLEAYMACGIGACAGCVSPLLREYKKVCSDGPVFSIREII
ncbi:hypothetical protein JW890_08160 [candidate division WOR-3 bacterium]|nr:hypothetical protein [candidate division WOR-3 bacterium]